MFSFGICLLLIVFVSLILAVMLGMCDSGSTKNKESTTITSFLVFGSLFLIAFFIFIDTRLYDGPITIIEPQSISQTNGYTHVIFNDNQHTVSELGKFAVQDPTNIVISEIITYTWWDNIWETKYLLELRDGINTNNLRMLE